MPDEYAKNLERIIRQMLQPLRDIPLNLVIESLSGHKIIPFDFANSADAELLEDLKKIAQIAGHKVNRKPIIRSRPNEVGNDIEEYVKLAFKKMGCAADTPSCKSGGKKSMGYPDLCFIDKKTRMNYLECKTYNADNVETSQRSFYLSPSADSKITRDAHHFVLSFEVYVDGRKKNKYVFKCRRWRIIDVEKLPVDVKYEFNSDNERLYSKEYVLAEGQV